MFEDGKWKTYLTNTILGFQHVFAMMGSNILVPLITNLPPYISLVTAGAGTILFHFVAQRKVPVFLGSSFSFVTAMLNIQNYGMERGWSHDKQIGHQMVAVIMAGVLYFIFSGITFLVGPERVKKAFPPIVVGPVIIVIGMTLAPTVISSYIVGQYTGESPAMKSYEAWIVALLTAIIIIACSIFGRGFLKLIPVLIGIIVGYIMSAIFGIIDYDHITKAHWIIFEKAALKETFGFYKYLGWSWSCIVMLSPISIVSFMEHLGDITTNGAVVGRNFFADPGLHWTLLGDGLAVCLAGFLGGPPVTTYGENTGVLAITRNYNPNLILLAGIFSLFLGLITKFGGVLASVPGPVIGGASMVMFGMIAAMGLKVMVDARVDFTDSRNLIIAALILVIGLGFSAGNVNVHIKDISISPLAICTVVGIILNLVLSHIGGDNKEKDKSQEDDTNGNSKGSPIDSDYSADPSMSSSGDHKHQDEV